MNRLGQILVLLVILMSCATTSQNNGENKYNLLAKPYFGMEFYFIQHQNGENGNNANELVSNIYPADILHLDQQEAYTLVDCIVPTEWLSTFRFGSSNEKLKLVFKGRGASTKIIEIGKSEIDALIRAASGQDPSWRIDRAMDWFLVVSGPNPWNGRSFDYYGGQSYSKNAVFAVSYLKSGLDYLKGINEKRKIDVEENLKDPNNRFRGGYWLGDSEVIYVIDMDIWHVHTTNSPSSPFEVTKIGNLGNLASSDVKFVADKTGEIYIELPGYPPFAKKWNREEAVRDFALITKSNSAAQELIDRNFKEVN